MESITLAPLQELKLFLKGSLSKAVVCLDDGFCEANGLEMAPSLEYSLNGPQICAFTSYQGCVLSIKTEGTVETEQYAASNVAFNLHFALKNRPGSRVLVLGLKDVGKTTLARKLASYQQRTNPGGYLVNLDPHLSHVSVPSQISVFQIDDSIIPTTSLLADSDSTTHLNPLTVPAMPLVRSVGFQSIKSNKKLYREAVKKLALDLNKRIAGSGTAATDVLIDTPPLTIADWEVVDDIITSFKINTVVMIDNDRFWNDFQLKTSSRHSNVTVVNLPKFENLDEKDAKYERMCQQFAIRTYFYGLPTLTQQRGAHDASSGDNGVNVSGNTNASTTIKMKSTTNTLNPYSMNINTSDLIFLRPVEVLDLTETTSDGPLFEVIEDPKEMELVNAVVALIDDKNLKLDPASLVQDVVSKSTIGLAYIQSVNDAQKKMKLLVPIPMRTLPSRVAIVTEMRYVE